MDEKQDSTGYNPKKYNGLLTFLYVLLGLVGTFNICIFSYIGCEIVPYLLTRDSTPAEVQASAPPAAAQPAATQPPATSPPSAAPVAETDAPGETEPPAESPATADPSAVETDAPDSTTAPAAETTASGASSKGVYVGSIEQDKFHYPGCQHAERILPENEIWFDTVAQARADGRSACETCNPR